VRLADELMQKFETKIESLTLVPSTGGRYEVSVNGQLLFSKLKTGRFPEPGEVIGLVQNLSKKKL